MPQAMWFYSTESHFGLFIFSVLNGCTRRGPSLGNSLGVLGKPEKFRLFFVEAITDFAILFWMPYSISLLRYNQTNLVRERWSLNYFVV